jgi:catalase
LTKAGAVFEIIAPAVGGVKASDGTMVAAQQMIDGGPSVLYDAVALLVSDAGAGKLAKHAPARDFVADAFAHCKFIGYSDAASDLLEKAGVTLDEGIVALNGKGDVEAFVEALGALRIWSREKNVKMT